MKAKVIEIESQTLSDFCYNHGGIRVDPFWYDEQGETDRFMTQDRRHRDCDTYSYVYISKEYGKRRPIDLICADKDANVATCTDEDGDNCYIMCQNPKEGEIFEFDKKGFFPYANNPEPNRFGQNRNEV